MSLVVSRDAYSRMFWSRTSLPIYLASPFSLPIEEIDLDAPFSQKIPVRVVLIYNVEDTGIIDRFFTFTYDRSQIGIPLTRSSYGHCTTFSLLALAAIICGTSSMWTTRQISNRMRR